MKIALLTKSISRKAGGLLEAIRVPIEHFDDSKLDLRVFAVSDEYSEEDMKVWGKINVSHFPAVGPTAFGYSPEMKAALELFSPDLIHTHGLFYYTSVLATQWGTKNKCPYVISPHGMLDKWALKNSQWKKMVFGYLFEKRHLQKSGCIHSLCESETTSIRRYGLNNPVCIIPNGVDLPSPTNRLNSPWDGVVKSEKKVLLYLGRIHPKKGLSGLLAAWGSVQNACSFAEEWVLGVVGWDQGGHEDELKCQAREYDIEDSVVFLGPQFDEAKKACYQNASGFILPSLSEGLPLVVLEAWAHKLPVIMTPQCNLPEGFESVAAIKIDPDKTSIENGLKAFFSLSGSERQAMGQNGHDLVKENFTSDKSAKDLYSVYQWLLEGGASPHCVVLD